ncbi:MAG: bifunctional demethylmenaquinone methyltransferase/2-methoxy-6-polyprenyl-1,4-benzoquinol methylase UbiE [Nevskia sp.]
MNTEPHPQLVPNPRLAPHPLLTGYYSDEPGRLRRVQQLFDSSAGDYDRINRLMSFGSGAHYRGDALRRLGVAPGDRLLDVGSGTGVIARLAQDIVGERGLVVAVDPSSGMLAEARSSGVQRIVHGRGESLPFADASFDVLTMGYALRHVADLDGAFREYRRVLRPAGRVLLLEITRPRSEFGTRALRWYMHSVVPRLARSPDAAELMRYYWDTIEQCVPPETILASLRKAGFADARRETHFSILSEYGASRV